MTSVPKGLVAESLACTCVAGTHSLYAEVLELHINASSEPLGSRQAVEYPYLYISERWGSSRCTYLIYSGVGVIMGCCDAIVC